jgi:hypothetical protein
MTKELSTHAAAAKLIRKEIKARGLKARVTSQTYAGGNSVHIHFEDLKPSVFDSINSFCNKFQYGSFDGMTDSYNYDNRNDELPQVRFVTATNNLSDIMREMVYAFIKATYAGGEDLPSKYIEGCNAVLQGEYMSSRVYHSFKNETSDFWEHYATLVAD